MNMKEQFEADGYIIVPDFLTETEIKTGIAEINAHYDPLIIRENSSANKPGFQQFGTEVVPWHPFGEDNPYFRGLLRSEKLDRITIACIGERYKAEWCLVMLSPPGGQGQAWHQDCTVGEDGHYNVNRLMYVEDVTPDNGAIVIVPGSHHMGAIPEGGHQDPIPGEITLMPRAGTLILLSGLVYHRVTPNRSEKPRTSINFRAYAEGVSEGVCGVGLYRNGAYDFRSNTVVKD